MNSFQDEEQKWGEGWPMQSEATGEGRGENRAGD